MHDKDGIASWLFIAIAAIVVFAGMCIGCVGTVELNHTPRTSSYLCTDRITEAWYKDNAALTPMCEKTYVGMHDTRRILSMDPIVLVEQKLVSGHIKELGFELWPGMERVKIFLEMELTDNCLVRITSLCNKENQ